MMNSVFVMYDISTITDSCASDQDSLDETLISERHDICWRLMRIFNNRREFKETLLVVYFSETFQK